MSQVGLSGSSAIVVATFRALMEYYQVSLSDIALTPGELAQVILDVERSELGISAGLQDRVVQSVGGLVHMDFSCFTPASHTSSSASLSVSSDVSIANVSTVSANNSSSSGLFPSLLSPMKFMNRSATVAAQVSVNDTNDKNSNNSQTNPNPNPNKIVSQKTSAQQSTNSPITPNKTLKELVVNKDGTLSSTSVQSPGTPSVFPSKLLASNSIPSIQTGIYTSLNPTLLPPLYLAYNTVAGGDSGQVHSTVKERWAKRLVLKL